jgi:hypothetical protein
VKEQLGEQIAIDASFAIMQQTFAGVFNEPASALSSNLSIDHFAGRTLRFRCHDYQALGHSNFAWETTVAAERQGNFQIHADVDEHEFVAMR